MKSKRGRSLIIVIGGIVLLGLLLFYGMTRVYPKTVETKDYITTTNREETEVIELEEGNVYQQTIVAPRDEIAGFNIRFGNYSSLVNGKLQIRFEDDNSIYYDEEFGCQEIIDNEYHFFQLKQPILNGAGKEYTITIEVTDLAKDQKLAMFASNSNIYPEGKYIGNGIELDNYDLACQLSGTSGFMWKWYLITVVLIMLGYSVVCYLGFLKKSKIEYVYLAVALTFGMVFILCFPPYTAPDEEKHIATTYAHVNSFLGESPITDENEEVIFRETDAEVGTSSAINRQRFDQLYPAFAYSDKGMDRTESYGTIVDVPFFIYLPQILGVLLGMLLKLSGFWTMYLGKFFAMLFFSGCTFLAIRIIPWGKMVLFTIALLPMTLELATSYSYDSVIIALCMLFISYVMFLIYKKERVTWKDVCFLAAIICIIAPCKMFYFLIAGMLFLIPKEKYGSKKLYWGINGGILILGILTLVIYKFQFLASHVGTVSTNAFDKTSVNYSISSILGNIPNSILVLFNTMLNLGEFYYQTMIGAALGWFQVCLPAHIITGFAILLFSAAFIAQEKEATTLFPTSRFRLTMWGFSLLMFLGVLAALWIGWTPVTYSHIEGVQGRYFLPFLPMVFLAFKNRVVVFRKNIDMWIVIGLFILLIFSYFWIAPYALV